MALQELTRRKPILKNRTPPEVEEIIVELSLDRPAYGQIRIANELRKLGHSISPAGVRGVWQRHDLETMKKQLKALEMSRSGRPGADRKPTRRVGEGQERKEAHGGVRRANVRAIAKPRIRSTSATPGVSRIYQQTFIDTTPKVAFAKLYDRKTPITAADLVNDRVVPFYDARR